MFRCLQRIRVDIVVLPWYNQTENEAIVLSSHGMHMNDDIDMKVSDRRKIRLAMAADKAIRKCAMYFVTQGGRVPVDVNKTVRVFSEMKRRLEMGSFRDITHLKSYVYGLYGLQDGRRG